MVRWEGSIWLTKSSRAAQDHIQLALETLQGGDSTIWAMWGSKPV